MCYKFPGPRCAAYTRAKLETSHNAYLNDPTPHNYAQYQFAQTAHDATKGGQKELIELLSSEQYEQGSLEREILQKRLDDGKKDFAQSKKALEASEKVEEKPASISTSGKPIVLQETTLTAPNLRQYNNLSNGTVIDITYREECPCYDGHDNEYDDGTCRDSYITDIKVKSIDTIKVLQSLFESSDIPEELINLGKNLKLNQESSYNIYGEPDYYGETLKVELDKDKEKQLVDWYYSQPNATDPSGALNYCRQQGLDTTGKTPDKAIKEYLVTKYGNEIESQLEGARVHIDYGPPRYIRLEDIDFNEKNSYYHTPTQVRGEQEIQGIVLGSGYNDYGDNYQILELLDGYENVHHMWNKVISNGRFIRLTRE